MVVSDFPLWFQAGCYGGLLCCALVSATRLRSLMRGGRVRWGWAFWTALLAGLAAFLLLPALFWFYVRFLPKQGHLGALELALMLIYVALCGWVLPLGAILLSFLFASADPASNVLSAPAQSAPLATTGRLQPPRYQAGVEMPFVRRDDKPWGWLEYRGGKFQGQRLALKRVMATIGRDEQCDIWVDDEMASRHHAELAWDSGRVCLTDCESLNGTLLNKKRVRGTVLLSSNDLIEIGEHRFLFLLADLNETPDDDPLIRHTWRSACDFQTSVSGVVAVTGAESGGVMPGESAGVTPPLLPVSDQPGGDATTVTPPSAPITRWGVRVLAGSLAGQIFVLNRPVITLGRDLRCDWILPDVALAPRQARLLHRPEGDYIEDLTGYGGLLNEQPFQSPQLLKAGDIIRLANVRLEYVLMQTVRTTPLPPTLAQDSASTPASLPSSTVPWRSLSGPMPLKLPSRRKE